MIILRNRRFGLLWGGQLLSNLGNWMMIVAIPVYVYQLTGSTLSAGLAFVAETLPALVLGPFAGVFVDRWDRRTVMVVSDVLRAGCVAALVFVRDGDALWLLYVLVLAENSFGQFFQPAHRAMVPAVVGRADDLERANSWYAISSGTVRLAGAPVGGVLYATIGFEALVLVNSATYIASALAVMSVRLSPAEESGSRAAGGAAGESDRPTGFLAEFRYGVAFLWRQPVLRGLLFVSSLFLLANAAINVILVPYVVSGLGGTSTEVGLLMSALGAGYLLSAFAGSAMSRSGRLRRWTVVCLVGIALAFAGLFNLPHMVLALVFIGLAGVPGGALLLLVQVQMQRHSPDHVIGRVGSVFAAGEMTATVVGALIGSLAGDAVGLVTTANTALGVLGVAVLVGLRVLPARVVGEAPSADDGNTITVTTGGSNDHG